jgi:tRNA C32,U32 (ribose-2'-O)-methylase TrmJ
VPEAYEYAVSAGHLLDSAVRHESTEAACADTTLVFATSARTALSIFDTIFDLRDRGRRSKLRRGEEVGGGKGE